MKNLRLIEAATALLACSVITSHASLTTVEDIWAPESGSPPVAGPGDSSEWNLYNSGSGSSQGAGIMEYLYGTGNFTRVNDANDVQWAGLNGGAVFDAIYASAGQALYTAGTSGTPISSQILGGPGSTGTTPSRSGTTISYSPVSQPFLFLDEANGNMAYSDPTLSSGGVDRMVTFAVTGYLATAGNSSTFTPFSDGTTHYVIAFEDGTDNDYNDLVVEVSGVTPVPEPTTLIAGAMLLLPFGASTMRFVRKSRVA